MRHSARPGDAERCDWPLRGDLSAGRAALEMVTRGRGRGAAFFAMGRRKPKRRNRRKSRGPGAVPGGPWLDEEGLHVLQPGDASQAAPLAALTRAYQAHIRNSPLWDEMVREFGVERAEQLLQEFRVEQR